MLILGILAAIAIPSFLNQRDKARDADAKAAARTAQTAAETIATDNNGNYSGVNGVTVARLGQVEPTLAGLGANLSVPAVGASTYTVRVTSETGNAFDVSRTAGSTFTYTCTVAGTAGCPPDGNWAD
jgi:type IV pilus assembly protein PilA